MVEEEGVPREIDDALARGATILTGNQRAARALRQAFDRQNRAAGHLSWTPPPILAWSAWTNTLWRDLLLSGSADQLLLNRTQEHALWRAIVAEDETLSTLKTPESLAQMAAEAWAALARYRGLNRLKGSATNTDTEAFLRWSNAFEDRCRTSRYLPEPRLEAALRHAIQAKTLPLSNHAGLCLTGFDRLLPSQTALLEAIRSTGTPVEIAPPNPIPAIGQLRIAKDEDHELQSAAIWARTFLETHPNARIALIAPNPTQERPNIDRVLRSILAPETQSIAATPESLPWEFSAGAPLAESPIIATALDLLTWVKDPLPREQVTSLLLSPYLATPAEQTARAEFDAFDLRKANLLRPEISLSWLIAKLEASKRRSRLTSLHTALTSVQITATRRLSQNDRRPHAEWSELIRELLASAAWATRPHEDSIEFQTREKWESALDELTTLDFEGLRVPWSEALASLRRIAHETIFAPESREAPIQIIGPEESNGQQFDAIWFLRAADLTWPVPISGSPLLAWPLRRELGIPGSDLTADSTQARAVTHRIATCATDTIVFSYAHDSTEGHQRPSPALTGLDLTPTQANPIPQPTPLITLEATEDTLPILPLPEGPIPGGALILRDQAACAFRAFAQHRLTASEPEDRVPGLDARERGTAIHHVLEHFWEEVKTQAALKAMPRDARRTLLSRLIDDALSRASTHNPTPWDRAYIETQHTRLMTLCTQWLDLELTRAPFTVISRETEARDVAIGPLHLTLRIDRIDETPNGHVLIDYKSSDVIPSAWLTGRPDEPQLPLYAVLAEDIDLEAIAFGKLRVGKDMALTGFQETSGTLTHPSKLKGTTLETQRETWYEVLTTLATDFVNGDARVSPKLYPTTCEYCAHRVLCRLDLSAVEPDEEEDEDLEDFHE